MRPLAEITQSTLLDYLRTQLDRIPKPAPQTIYHRLSALRCVYRFHHGREIPGPGGLTSTPAPRSPFAYGGPRRAVTAFQLQRPRRLVVPLTADEAARFWRGFRAFRDLAVIALMLFDGLRSQEVLAIHNYLRLERPLTNSPGLFVSLQGPHRGQSMTPAGLRSLFRHHRRQTQVLRANPHRFRHTFGADMVRAGISLPALMRLMGHSHILTTMLYVTLSPEDVWREFHRAIQNRSRLRPPQQP